MSWKNAWERAQETEKRLEFFRKEKLSYGIKFLDDALGGIMPVDLTLIGAPSGAGKTGFVTNLALANIRAGKKVHYIALEAYEGEIEDRIQYAILANIYFSDPNRKHARFNMRNWREGKLKHIHLQYMKEFNEQIECLKNLETFYYGKRFGIDDFIRNAFLIEDDTSLIIVDHVHYFDIDDENENRGMKSLIKEIRNVQFGIKKPIVLVSHLRKPEKRNAELCADMYEFHGSSDLVKIATQVVTIGKGDMPKPGVFESFIRIPKNRWDGGVTFYTGKVLFSLKKNAYEEQSKIGILTKGGTQWEELAEERLPDWARKPIALTRPPQSLTTSENTNYSLNQNTTPLDDDAPPF